MFYGYESLYRSLHRALTEKLGFKVWCPARMGCPSFPSHDEILKRIDGLYARISELEKMTGKDM